MSEITPVDQDANASAADLIARAEADRQAQIAAEAARNARQN